MPTKTAQRPAGTRPRAGVWPDGVLRVATLGEQGSDGFHRSWIMLFPEGDFEHEQYGALHFTRKRLAEIKANFDRRVRHIDIALDANHDQDKATGWLERVELRDGGADAQDGHAVPPGLWGLVRWTPLGLKLLRDQIYRYFSPEFGPWRDPETGQRHQDVLIGGGLTNRPFLKKMPAVQLKELAEVSTRPWGQVKKSCLPRACFLIRGDPDDKSTWRLPIYEGAGPKDAAGHYTRRGKLNINAVRAALAALGGARTGKPMAGVPSGTRAKLERLLQRYGGGDAGGEREAAAASTRASEGGMREMAGATTGKRAKRTGGKTVNLAEELFEAPRRLEEEDLEEREDELERDEELEGDAEDGDEELELDEGDGDGDGDGAMQFASKGGKSGKAGKPADAEDALDGGADEADEGDEAYDDGSDGDEMSEDDLDDSPTEGTSGRASSKTAKGPGHSQRAMPAAGATKKASEGKGMRGDGGRMTLAELQAEVIRLRERDAENSYRLYERDVEDQLRRWERGESLALSEKGKPVAGKRAPVALSRSFKEAYRTLMLKEGYKLSERQRNGFNNTIAIALKDAVVDLSRRGSSFDQEARRTTKASDRQAASPDQSDRLEEHAKRLAQADGKVLSELGEPQKFALYQRAAEEIGYY